MFLATCTDATLCLNTSNHPSIPPEGLILVADVPTEVTAAQAEYLASLGVNLQDLTPTKPARSPKE